MRVLMLVQQMDETDWLRAFIVDWVRALAAHVDQIDVLTLERGQATLPENVTARSLGKNQGKEGSRNRAHELWNFQRAVFQLAPYADVIFSHMTPRYTWLAAPAATVFGKRQVLWFTHRHASAQTRAALACSWRVVTAMPESFPIASPKVRALGHGIDTEFFAPADETSGRGTACRAPTNIADPHPTIIHVARIMPIKHQATLIRALTQLPAARAVFVGDVPIGQEQHRPYADELKALADDLNVSDRVTFAGGLLPPAVRDAVQRATIAVNLSPPGLFDKAALESMATGIPTIVGSHAFDDLLGDQAALLRLDSPDDVDGLVERTRTLLALSPDERAQIGHKLRARVIESHSLDRLMRRLVNVFATGEPE
jgi:glycosyltransferase involved in cell wall biosynthesis